MISYAVFFVHLTDVNAQSIDERFMVFRSRRITAEESSRKPFDLIGEANCMARRNPFTCIVAHELSCV